MKVLFLDIDGVMNCVDSLNLLGTIRKFGPKHVDALNEVIFQTGAKIVISSAWRISNTKEEMQQYLSDAGVSCEVIDMTPVGGRNVHPGQILTPEDKILRGHEILEWLKACKIRITGMAIVDDDSDMVNLSDRLVQTSWQHGLEKKHIQPLIDKLNEPFDINDYL